MRITILGFGKIGQALGAWMLSGADLLAIDRDERIAADFAAGRFETTEPGVRELLVRGYEEGRLRFASEPGAALDTDAIVICIPLSVDAERRPQHVPFTETLKWMGPALTDKKLLVVETSLPVGFSQNRIVPALAELGYVHGVDYLLAHSPERIKSGSMLSQLASVPKVLAGLDAEALAVAVSVYKHFFDGSLLREVASIEAAELVKMAGMMYRDLNIALANQLAIFADTVRLDLNEIIPLINTDGEARLLQPGVGVGGHCTPVYPYFMIDSFRELGLDFSLAREARAVNDGMARHALTLVADLPYKKAMILGLAFRPGVREHAFSPAFSLDNLLIRAGLGSVVHDPLYTPEAITELGLVPVADLYGGAAELIFLVTAHPEYQQLDMERLYQSGVRCLVDGRNRINREKVERAGILYRVIGGGSG